jgi:ABC transporter substrate binding protein
MTVTIGRRELLVALGGGAAAWPFAARAQQAKLATIGLLGTSSAAAQSQWTAAFVQRMRDHGWIDGRNLTIEYRWAEGRSERFAEFAAEFVRLKVDVILTHNTPPVIAAKQATSVIPIVFATAADPVDTGLVASLARPGGASFNRPGANLTGVTFLSNKLVAKRLELLGALGPEDAPIGMLAHTHNPNTVTDVRDALAAAAALGRTLLVQKVATASVLSFRSAARETSGSETSRFHHADRRGCCVAAGGACSAAGDAGDRRHPQNAHKIGVSDAPGHRARYNHQGVVEKKKRPSVAALACACDRPRVLLRSRTSACALCGRGRRWRPRWPRGWRFRRLRRQHRATSTHSITSSARAMNVGVSSSPSALAVLRLTASSYLVGACTGRSPGFSPFKIRSM